MPLDHLAFWLTWGGVAFLTLLGYGIGWRWWGAAGGVVLGIATALVALRFSASVVMLAGYGAALLVGWVVFVLIDDLTQ